MPIPLGIFAVAGAGGPPAVPAMVLISTQLLTSTATSVTFSSIPQTFRHLQIRAVMRNGSTNGTQLFTEFNGVTTTSYAFHSLHGNGSSVASAANPNETKILNNQEGITANEGVASSFSSYIADILDYASTSKNTTLRAMNGTDDGSFGTRHISLNSGLFNNTSAITSLKMNPNSGNFAVGCRFSLYGIRG